MSTPNRSAKHESILHHRHVESLPFEPMQEIEADYRDAIIDHVTKTIAKCDTTINRLPFSYPHVEILSVPAGFKRPWTTLVTCGMGVMKMPGVGTPADRAFAELALCLPQDWPEIVTEDGKPGPGAWIVPMVHYLARIPFEYDSWLGEYHTIPNGDPAESLADGSLLTHAMIIKPRRIRHPHFHEMLLTEKKTIHFWSVMFLTENEMKYKESKGEKALVEKLKEAKVDELLSLDRISVCKSGFLYNLFN